ncbi:TonB-dependent siderophore receptor [Vibrio sp. vnigr-6D03]|uniref:TonB-dependent siderophore receptor n=1 Tax=Vibrio sp. vnigr-6D03 TaxID=2058088 RepID=UPI000C31E85F|nr:TonB-dependent siderophore receptor [Vibrio sp. vnigr-6D03]PKF78974.1 TonB-dependent siderophore receptor [Vibrio sp. vnigr-6D03]
MNQPSHTPTMRRSVIALAVAATFSYAPFVNADSGETETIEVFGKAYRNTATKTVLEPEETPQTLNVIESEQLEQRGVKSVMQALRYAPGVSTENKGGAVVLSNWVNIRGFSSSDNYYDGLMLPMLPGWNVQPQIDPVAIERLEIFKGPTSVLYGTMPPGGMVNVIAKAPQLEKSTQVNLATGSNSLLEASVDTTGSLSDNVAYRLIALARKSDTQIDHVKEERYMIAPSIDWYVSDKTFVNFNLYYQNDPALGHNLTLPLDAIKAGTVSPSTFAGDVNYNELKREFLLTGYKFNHEFNNNWTFLQNFRYMNTKFYQEGTQSGDYTASTGNLNRSAISTDENSKGFSIDNQLSGFISASNIDHYLLAGIDYRGLTGGAAYTAFSDVASINLHTPNNNKLNPNDFFKDSVTNTDVSMNQLGVYFQDQILLNNWVFIAGGRYDHVKTKLESDYIYYKSNGIVLPSPFKGEIDTDTSHHNFSYRLGTLYKFENGISPFANFATSFQPVAAYNEDQESLNPEIGNQIEVGVKYESYERNTTASAALFHITKENVAYRATGSDPYTQIGEVRSQGLELEGQTLISDNLELIANYTYTDTEITKDGDASKVGQVPVFVPEQAANLWSNYYVNDGAMQGLRVGGGVRYVGEAVLNDSTDKNLGKVESYTLVDMSLGYDLSRFSDSLNGASANVVANNLFNTEYYTCWNESHCWYGQERTVELNVKIDF